MKKLWMFYYVGKKSSWWVSVHFVWFIFGKNRKITKKQNESEELKQKRSLAIPFRVPQYHSKGHIKGWLKSRELEETTPKLQVGMEAKKMGLGEGMVRFIL